MNNQQSEPGVDEYLVSSLEYQVKEQNRGCSTPFKSQEGLSPFEYPGTSVFDDSNYLPTLQIAMCPDQRPDGMVVTPAR